MEEPLEPGTIQNTLSVIPHPYTLDFVLHHDDKTLLHHNDVIIIHPLFCITS